jgi:hypothetical protein
MGEDSRQTVAQRLGDLERRFDGPVPAALRRAALAGGPAGAERQDAIGRSALFDRLACRAVAAAARQRRRAAGAARATAAAELVRYRAAGLFWRDAGER